MSIGILLIIVKMEQYQLTTINIPFAWVTIRKKKKIFLKLSKMEYFTCLFCSSYWYFSWFNLIFPTIEQMIDQKYFYKLFCLFPAKIAYDSLIHGTCHSESAMIYFDNIARPWVNWTGPFNNERESLNCLLVHRSFSKVRVELKDFLLFFCLVHIDERCRGWICFSNVFGFVHNT